MIDLVAARISLDVAAIELIILKFTTPIKRVENFSR